MTTGLPARFTVLEVLARSEVEVVLRARDELLGREVWLKKPGTLLAKAFRNRDARDQALQEARALARVQHPTIVRLLDVVETNAGPTLVLEPSPGETLAERLAREKRLGAGDVAHLGSALAGALEALHAANIVHRGLAGCNVVLGADGGVRLLSASFVKDVAADTLSDTSLSFTVLGACDDAEEHASHPAPEQILGKKTDARADLFGLGWLLYRCLTGEDPFTEADQGAWKSPRDPLELAPETPRELARTLVRSLAPSPAKRFASAGEMRAALSEVERSLSATASGSEGDRRASAAPRTPGSLARGRWPALAGGIAALAVLATGVALWQARPGPQAAPGERGIAARGPEANPVGTFSDRYERSWAVLIGIGEAYGERGFPVLKNAERDVRALAERLDGMPKDAWQTSWDVTTLRESEATHDAILATVRHIGGQAGENDRLFLYYAGHGESHEISSNTGWIIPADAKPLSEDPERVSWLRFEEFQKIFDETRAKHVLVAMDCCYGGRLSTLRSVSPSPFAQTLLTQKAHVVITSGRPNEQVSDGPPGEHSPFASAFLAALEQRGEITSSMLMGLLQERYRAAGSSRAPQLGYPSGHPEGGEFVFFVE